VPGPVTADALLIAGEVPTRMRSDHGVANGKNQNPRDLSDLGGALGLTIPPSLLLRADEVIQ